MISGIYSSSTALDNYARQQEIIASNLAHVNTVGYRRKWMAFEELVNGANGASSGNGPEPLRGATTSIQSFDFQGGTREVTNRPLDLSLNGSGFLVYQGPEGELYSRNGVLFRNADQVLVNNEGMPLLDEDGEPIEVPVEADQQLISIDEEGNISSAGTNIATIAVVEFDDPQALQTRNQVYFERGDQEPIYENETKILQGSRERSNVQPVNELVAMMVGSRNFEAAQRAIRTISEAIQQNVRS